MEDSPVHVGTNQGDTAASSEDEDESSQLFDLANSILAEFKDPVSLSNLDTAIYLFREALDQRAAPHPLRSESLKDLAGALVTRFSLTNQYSDLDQAMVSLAQGLHALRERVEALMGAGRQSELNAIIFAQHEKSEASELTELAKATLVNINQSAQLSSLDTAVTLHREALLRRPKSHPKRLVSQAGLAVALYARFRRTGYMSNIDEAISVLRDAVEACPESDMYRAELLIDLTAVLAAKFDRTGKILDLHEATTQFFGLANKNYVEASQLVNSGNELFDQFRDSGQMPDIEKAISLFRKGRALLHVRHPIRLYASDRLANALIFRFGRTGQRKDLDESISLHRGVLALRPEPHPDRATSLNNLASGLSTQFDKSGRHEDLDESISLYREAQELESDQSMSLSNLAIALLQRFDESGQLDDLDEAISMHRRALELFPASHHYRSDALNNLCGALTARFEQSGHHEDLDEAILMYREALELSRSDHLLNNFGDTLKIRFYHSGQREDLDEAISVHREALKLRPAPHSLRCSSLNNLARTLAARSDQPGQRDDLVEAISLHREALALRPVPHPRRSISLNDLANALHSQFKQSGQREHLDEAIDLYYESLDAVVSGHPSICLIARNLGGTLLDAHSHTREPEYLNKYTAAMRIAIACESAPTSQRFRAAKYWAHHAEHLNHESALEAYHAAIQLLPRMAMLGLDLQSRQQALTSGSDGLARDAAACAIRSGQYDKAVELLEEGRAVFWSQALQLRTPIAHLREVAPELEQNLRRISLALEQGSIRDVSKKLSSVEQEASYFRRLNDEWLAALEKVRQLDDFRDFLRPSRLSTLQGAAVDGSVVILNASETACVALILTSTGIQHIPLLDLSFVAVTKLVKLLRYAISQDGRDVLFVESNRALVDSLVQQVPSLSDTLQLLRQPLERHVKRESNTSVQPDDIFRYVLGVLWESVVEPVIRWLDFEKSEDPPKLRWCSTGPFAFLPIHAAGVYLTERTECVSDYVVSSYTPTISSLLGSIPASTDSFKMMAVIQPDTPGQKSLPCTLEELRKIELHVPDKALVRLVPGFVEEVIAHLPAISVAHFACHGQQDIQNPLESALLLQDGQLKVSQIMQQSMPNASLAFLSACETAMGDENLPDEVIHLGSTLLFAGFRGVVATMWSIADPDGPKIADTFYESLFKEASSTTTNSSGPDITQSARALHIAVAKLRSENVSLVRWVPFIHLGR